MITDAQKAQIGNIIKSTSNIQSVNPQTNDDWYSNMKNGAYRVAGTTQPQQPEQSSFLGNVAKNVAGGVLGVGKTIGEAGINLGELPVKGLQYATGKMGMTGASDYLGQMAQESENIKKNIFENPEVTKYTNTPGGKIGQFAGDVGMLTSPTKWVAGAKAGMEALPVANKLSQIPKVGGVLSSVTQRLLNTLPEATVGTGYGLIKGQNPKEALGTGAFFGTLSGLGEVAGDTWRAIKGGLGENTARAIGIRGSMKLGDAAQKIPQAIKAFKTISDNAKDVVVKDLNGVEKAFEPTKATFYETMQALKQTKDNVYNAYTELAQNAGDKGATFTAQDFNNVVDNLKTMAKDSTSSWKSKVNSLIKDLGENFGNVSKSGKVSFKDTELARIQSFVEKVNKDINPMSDKAGSEVSGTLSKKLREIMDSKIESATGEGYQKLRSSYGDLKSVEDNLINQFKKASGKGGGWFSSYIEGFGSLESILGVISRDPAAVMRGVGMGTFGKIMQTLRDPETYLKRAFQQIQEGEKVPSAGSVRAFGQGETPQGFKQGEIPPTTPIAPQATKLGVSTEKGISDPLAQEARKYKSAEEFVKKQIPVYHGSPVPLKKFSNKKGGAFFTDSMEDASGFAGNSDNVYEGYLNFKKPLIIDAKGAKWDELNTKWGESTQEIISNAEKEGYDGVTFKNIVDNVGDTTDFGGQSTIHYAYKPENAFVNESQLTDFYNQAVKGVEK